MRCYAQWLPPPPLKLVEWADDNIVLPATQSAGRANIAPGPICASPGRDRRASPEYVTISKSSRIGFTKGLMIAIGGDGGD